MSEITKDELYILSYYRASELAGAILFSRLAFNTDIDKLRINLTKHTLEETYHAWLWTETIKELEEIPLKITNPYQREYAKRFGMPKNMLEILCLTQIFENRTIDHYMKHIKMKGIHPKIKETLQKVLDDELGHISWIKKELETYDEKEVNKVIKKLEEIDADIYKSLLKKNPFKEYFGEKIE